MSSNNVTTLPGRLGAESQGERCDKTEERRACAVVWTHQSQHQFWAVPLALKVWDNDMFSGINRQRPAAWFELPGLQKPLLAVKNH